VSCWYRVAGLVSREQKTLAVEIIEAEIRSTVHEVLLDAARLVLSGDPVEIARQLRPSGADDTANADADTSTVSRTTGALTL